MGFQLVISEGKEAGREFEFDQASVVIGRTAECDVILYEAGVSRKHARITTDERGIFIEDMGSSNGTLVNNVRVSGSKELRDGDQISMGPVIFSFKPVELEPTAPGDDPPVEGGQHTRVVSMAELKKSRNKAVAMLPQDASREEVAEMVRRPTKVVPAMKGLRVPTGDPARTSDGKGLARQPPAKLAAREEDLPAGVEVGGGGRPRLARATGERAPLSAADRARMKRSGAVGKAQLWWAEASKSRRALAISIAGLVTLALVGGLVVGALPDGAKPAAPEPQELGTEPLEASFGLGDVTYERADQKAFDFEVRSPVQVMAVLHYQARDINSKDEVSITVNGVELAWLPPDTLDANERTLEVLIPAKVIKRDEVNTVTFDNVKNPPEADTWRIWNLWLEVAVLPERDEAGLIADAEAKYKRGSLKWEQRDIGASNRWDAYKNFREAWLTLEALPPGSRPATYLLSRDRMHEAKRSLDEKCNELLLKSKSAFQFGKFDQARYELTHVKDFFPSRAHPCQGRADYEWQQMEL